MSDSIRSLSTRDTQLSEPLGRVEEGPVSRGPVMIEELENQRFQSDVDAAHVLRHNLHATERKPLPQRLKETRERKDIGRGTSGKSGDKDADAVGGPNRLEGAADLDHASELTLEQAQQRDLGSLLDQFKRHDNGLSDTEKEELKEKYKNLTHRSFGIAEIVPTLSKEMAVTFNAVKTVMGEFNPEKNVKQHEALKLFDEFEANIGHENLVQNLNKVAALNAKERMPSVLGTRHVMNIWFAKNLLLIQSCYASAADLRGHFSGTCQIKTMASERETVRLLLRAPSMDDRSTDGFVGKLFTADQADVHKKALACRAVRRCVGDLPITLWPVESLQQRQDFLIKLDELAMGSDKQRSTIPSNKLLIEIRERARIERLRQSGWSEL